jgi:hypothetical protein
MNNGVEGKNTQEICIDEKKKDDASSPPSVSSLAEGRKGKKEVLIFRKLALLLLLLSFFVLSFFSFSLYYPQCIDIMSTIGFLMCCVLFLSFFSCI